MGIIILFLVAGLSYAFGSRLAIALIEASGLQGVFFIPAGLTVAFLLRLERRFWWVVLVAAGLAEFLMDVSYGFTPAQAAGFSLANMVEPVVGASIVVVGCGVVDLARRRDLVWFSFGAILIGPAVGAAVGATADRFLGGDEFLTTFLQWWLGDALGVILVGGMILSWGSSADRRSLWAAPGAALVIASAGLTVGLLTLSDLPLVFSVLVGVVIAGAMFGTRAVAVISVVVAFTISVTLAYYSGELVVGLTQAEALLVVKLEVAIFAIAGFVVAAEAYERELAVSQALEAVTQAAWFEKERQREHELAIQVQRGLLPDRPLSRKDLSIAARYEAASEAFEVGGDWYDTIQLRDGRVAIVVGDVVGHGIEAMTAMGRLRTAFGALALHTEGPGELLRAVDEFVGGPDGADFATAFVAVIDPESGTIKHASAGHPPPLLVQATGEATWLESGLSGPLYGETGNARGEASVEAEPGSVLVIFSDGLIERRGESLSIGMARLEAIIPELAAMDPQAICDELVHRLGVSVDRADDVVVLAVRLEPVSSDGLHIVAPAEAEELGSIRDSIRRWSEKNALHATVRDDLLLAVGEAASNVVRHAYEGGAAGNIDLDLVMEGEMVRVVVRDTGRWRQPLAEDGYRGVGMAVIQSLSHDFQIDRSEDGTLIRFKVPVIELA